jgi:hypothetical protein
LPSHFDVRGDMMRPQRRERQALDLAPIEEGLHRDRVSRSRVAVPNRAVKKSMNANPAFSPPAAIVSVPALER